MDVKVEEYTSSTLVTIDLNASLDEALKLMQANGIRHLPVVEDGAVTGVISERDLMANYGKPWSTHLRVKEIMSTDVLYAHMNDSLGKVAYELSKNKKGSAIILDENEELYGIFTTTDALNALVEMMSGNL